MGRWDIYVDKKVNFGEIAGNWWQDVALVYLLENELDLGFSSWYGLLHERVMKRLMESELMPAPLFCLDVRMVLHICSQAVSLVWGGGCGMVEVGYHWL